MHGVRASSMRRLSISSTRATSWCSWIGLVPLATRPRSHSKQNSELAQQWNECRFSQQQISITLKALGHLCWVQDTTSILHLDRPAIRHLAQRRVFAPTGAARSPSLRIRPIAAVKAAPRALYPGLRHAFRILRYVAVAPPSSPALPPTGPHWPGRPGWGQPGRDRFRAEGPSPRT